jgi:multidrug efflux pump subunit AcrB
VILVSLKQGHAPTADYVRRLRAVLPAAFPSVTFYFQSADMMTQILNFGLPAQIDLGVVGRDRANNLRVAHELRRRIAGIAGIADAHLQQELDAPAFMVNIDRSRALQLGLNAQAIANNVNTSLSSSEQVAPNFWTDPAAGIPYFVAVQTPEHQLSSLNELGNTPVSTALAANGPPIPGLLSNVATLRRDSVPTNLNQTNVQPVYDIYASVSARSSLSCRRSSSPATESGFLGRSRACTMLSGIWALDCYLRRCSSICSWSSTTRILPTRSW